MFDWILHRRKRQLPDYSRLRATPSRQLPPDLREWELAEPFMLRRNASRDDLGGAHRPADDQPLFTTLLLPGGNGVVTMVLPDQKGRCLLLFSTPLKAADYVQTLISSGGPARYLSSTPLDCQRMISDLANMGAEGYALDRCPRCGVCCVMNSRSIHNAADLLTLWSIQKGGELARADLYFGYALEAARAGALEVARDVALETVGHVSLEDPRLHLLLGQVAVGLRDRRLLAEAKSFLRFLKLDPWERRLDEVEHAGVPDFQGPV
jgi:hypothetical protein